MIRLPTWMVCITFLFLTNYAHDSAQPLHLASAIKCTRRADTASEELKAATRVFSGTAMKVTEADSKRVAEFEVERVWKGALSRRIAVSSGTHLYGSRFKEGETYLVFAFGGKELSTSICTRTKPLSSASRDLAELGEGQAVK
jgi:hypothetical protein